MNSLCEMKKFFLQQYTDTEREIVGIWATDCLYNPIGNGRIFKCKFIVVQTQVGQGCAYSEHDQYDSEKLVKLVGKDCLKCELDDLAFEVACVDSLAEKIFYGYKTETIKLEGLSLNKLHARTEIIINEAKKLVGNLVGKKVLNVGVVGDIIFQFLKHGCQVIGSDFDSTIIGKTFFDKASIASGVNTLDILKTVDIAVVTGMTIVTQTLDSIINVCREHNVKLIVFAETGSNMAQYYVQQGVDCYLSETFPFYIFNGESTISITRRERLESYLHEKN